MEEFDTQIRSPTDTWSSTFCDAIVLVLPFAISFLVFMIAGMHAMEEPYGIFTWPDAALQVGGPILVVIGWLGWFCLFWSRRRKIGLLSLSVMLWAIVTTCYACQFAKSYFGQPWVYEP
ncbi:MAG TPA: hypothetical protein VF595_07050 [Tepidisphaeraceae bacterium]|jgi:hypothetical protein